MKVLELTHSKHNHNEETRKLQITGGSTYVLSLPKRWVTQNGFEKGSLVLVRQEENGTLAVLPPELGKSEKAEDAIIKVSPEDSPEALIRKMVSAYLVGYNIIHKGQKSSKSCQDKRTTSKLLLETCWLEQK